MKASKTGIRLMHLNRPFLDGKAVLPNSVLSMKKFYACALEYGYFEFLQIHPLVFKFVPFLRGNSVT